MDRLIGDAEKRGFEVFEESDRAAIPILLPYGVEKSRVIDAVLDRLKLIADRLTGIVVASDAAAISHTSLDP